MNNFKSYIINKYKTNVTALTDYPSDDGVSADQLRAIFDGRTNEEVKDSINGIIGALLAPSAAEQIGANGGTVQEMLDSKVEKEEGKGLSSEDFTTEHKRKLEDFEPDKKADVANPKLEGVVELDGLATIGLADGKLIIHKPFIDVVPGCEVVIDSSIHVNGDEVYTKGNLKNITSQTAFLDEAERQSALTNLGINEAINTQKVYVGGAEIYRDMVEDEYGNATGNIILYRPETGVTPESALKIGYDLLFSKGGENYEVYHAGNLKDITAEGANFSDEDKRAALANLGITAEVNTEKVKVNGVDIYYDEESASFFICVPAGENEWHVPYMPTTVGLSEGKMRINNETVFHSGNLKNLAWAGQQLDDMTEKANFMHNTGLDKIIGDIETALDSIIAMQNALIGGEG